MSGVGRTVSCPLSSIPSKLPSPFPLVDAGLVVFLLDSVIVVKSCLRPEKGSNSAFCYWGTLNVERAT